MRTRSNFGRRGNWLLLLVIAGVLFTATPSWASYAANRVVQTSISTASVPLASGVTVTKNWCHPVHSTNFDVSWQAGGSAMVTGYRISAHLNDGTTRLIAETDATGRSVTAEMDRATVDAFAPTFSVTTLTRTNWTAASAQSSVFVC